MTAFDFLLILLSAAALHRLWNYEAVCARPRAWADKIPYLRKPLLCAACNAFWFGAAALVLWKFSHPILMLVLATFSAARGVQWLLPVIDTFTKPKTVSTPTQPVQKQPTTQIIPSTPRTAEPTQENIDRHVVILTALSDFRSSYSVATAVLDQARAIAMVEPTWHVQVWTIQGAQEQGWDNMPANVSLHKIVPRMNWIENQSDEQASMTLRNFILQNTTKLKNPAIITHDLLFVSWFAVFARAIHMIGGIGNYQWFHVAHSLPSDRQGKLAALTTLPAGRHTLVPVAAGYEKQFAQYYDAPEDRVWCIPNVRDPRTWGHMTPRVQQLVTKLRLWEHDIVQIFPVCTTRLEAKGFSKLVRTFSFLNESISAFLLVCNPNAGGPRGQQILTQARIRVAELKLSPERFAFSSDILPDTATYGLTSVEIKTLMQDYGNVFVFPSMSEADSLIMMEAALSGQYIVGNSDVPTLVKGSHWTVPFGRDAEVNGDVCRYAANRVLDNRHLFNTVQRRVLRERNLNRIGHMWGTLIAGPKAS